MAQRLAAASHFSLAPHFQKSLQEVSQVIELFMLNGVGSHPDRATRLDMLLYQAGQLGAPPFADLGCAYQAMLHRAAYYCQAADSSQEKIFANEISPGFAGSAGSCGWFMNLTHKENRFLCITFQVPTKNRSEILL
jgi:hypothetical protein